MNGLGCCLLFLLQTVFSIIIRAFNWWPLGHSTSNKGGKVNWKEPLLMQNTKSHHEVIPVFQLNVSSSARTIHSCISSAVVILQNTPYIKWSDEFLLLRLNCVYTCAHFNTVQCKAVLFSPWHKRWELLEKKKCKKHWFHVQAKNIVQNIIIRPIVSSRCNTHCKFMQHNNIVTHTNVFQVRATSHISAYTVYLYIDIYGKIFE